MGNALPASELFQLRIYEENLLLFASELHRLLGISSTFKTWWGKILASGFIAEGDYEHFTVPIIEGGALPNDYGLSLSCATRICILEGTAIAKVIYRSILALPEEAILDDLNYQADKELMSPTELAAHERCMQEGNRSRMHVVQ
ncbi:antA/AntB antirepressor family protein [uncultured Mucilaginibacter sp.]|jgi:phage anti-repressor protein|uniref:antA/AntB antirepressor family protein n=1 Tax=uncultured Mucilaginibacter sp. TaxID=797541 RepID=UPI0025EEE2AB|nr:antA/AntB antirepressor family protein [uncultured Mucilaginibacter sp.]